MKAFHLHKVELALGESFPENKYPSGARHQLLSYGLFKKIGQAERTRMGPKVYVCVCSK